MTRKDLIAKAEKARQEGEIISCGKKAADNAKAAADNAKAVRMIRILAGKQNGKV